MSFTKKLVCFCAELLDAGAETEEEAAAEEEDEDAVLAAPQPVRAANSREVVSARPEWNFVIFMVCLSWLYNG